MTQTRLRISSKQNEKRQKQNKRCELHIACRLTGIKPHFAVYQSWHLHVLTLALPLVNKGLLSFWSRIFV